MLPFSAFSHVSWSTTPSSTSRFQGVPAFEISGQAAAGVSSGEAMAEVERMAAEIPGRSEEHTSELQSLMRISYAVFCLKKKTHPTTKQKQKNSTTKIQ